jgi:hypothetical protein
VSSAAQPSSLRLTTSILLRKTPKLKGKNGTGGVWKWSRERRDAELAKCQVLCQLHRKSLLRLVVCEEDDVKLCHASCSAE